MKFAIIGKKYQSDKLMYVEHLLALLRHYKAKILVEKSFANFLKQEKGSTLKVPKNSKWQKLPKTLEFKRQKE
jgi:hypothetical protein